MKASDYVAQFLQRKNITHVFELSGGMITHLLDSIEAIKTISIVTMHHEQGAAFAADGYARVKKIPGVALATSGPGATNLLTGIGSCFFDSVPAIFITGQVNVHELKGSKPIRQLGFQETDVVSMAVPITKACYQVHDAALLPQILEEAYLTAISGRPGPVLIDIPMNIQRASVEDLTGDSKYPVGSDIDQQVFHTIHQFLSAAKKPCILAGRGVLSSDSKKLLNQFLEIVQIPVITSLLAVDAVAFNNPLRAGFIGSYGNRWTNLSIGASDCILVIGSRLDIRQTGADVEGFKANKTIIHIDIEAGELNNRVQDCYCIQTDVNSFLQQAITYFSSNKIKTNPSWMAEINHLRAKWSDTKEITNIKGINPNSFIHHLSKASVLSRGYCVDVGSHQMWAAQSVELNENQFFITSGGMGAMGYSLPAAIGACFAVDKEPVMVICGDGGFQLNIQELQTIKRNELPVKVIILNNKSLGMIRQFQDSYFDGRHQSTVWGYNAPDFSKIALAYGIDAATIAEESEIADALQALWKDPHAPFLLQVMIDPAANAYPKIAFGKPITEMEPFSKPIDMEGT